MNYNPPRNVVTLHTSVEEIREELNREWNQKIYSLRGRTKGSKGRIIIKRRDYNERPEPYRIYDHREGIATEIRIRREG